MVVDPLLSTSVGASVFLLAIVAAVFELEKIDDIDVNGLDPVTIYTIAIFMTLFPVAILYTAFSLALGVINIDPSSLTMLKYIEWSFSGPMMLIGILLITKDRKILMEGLIAMGVLLLTGFSATLISGPLGIIMWFLVALSLGVIVNAVWSKGIEKARENKDSIKNLYFEISILVTALFILYSFYVPLSYDGFELIGLRTSRAVFTGLDIVSKVGFCAFLIRNIETIAEL